MAIDTKETRAVLNGLIETCKDGQKGFEDAAHHVKDPGLRTMFLEFSQQRSKFAGELQQEVLRLGEEPEKSGSTAGAVHRGWIDLKSKMTGESDEAVIIEAERGEDAAKKAYISAIEKNLPFDIQTIVGRQLEEVLKVHHRVAALKVHVETATMY